MSYEVQQPSTEGLRELVEQQRSELQTLRDELDRLRTCIGGAETEATRGPLHRTVTVSRASMLRTVAAASVGVVTAATLTSTGAAASNGKPLLLGESSTTHNPNTAGGATELRYVGKKKAGVAFLVNDTKFPVGTAAWPAAIGAWGGKHFAHGLFGYTDGKKAQGGIAPTAVAGFSLSGYGGYFSGKLAQISLKPQKGLHPGTGKAGDLFVDKNNDLWFCKGGSAWYHVV